jgi:hypothetical protein
VPGNGGMNGAEPGVDTGWGKFRGKEGSAVCCW